MALQAYTAGLDQFSAWTTATYHWLALSAGTFNITDDTLTNVLAGATEIGVTGYSRLTLTGAVRSVDDILNRLSYSADDPSWTGLSGGEFITALVLARHYTDDTDSVPLAWWNQPSVATNLTDPLTFAVAGGVIAYIDQAG